MSKLLFIHLPKFHVENFEDLAIIYSSFINDAKYTRGVGNLCMQRTSNKSSCHSGLSSA